MVSGIVAGMVVVVGLVDGREEGVKSSSTAHDLKKWACPSEIYNSHILNSSVAKNGA